MSPRTLKLLAIARVVQRPAYQTAVSGESSGTLRVFVRIEAVLPAVAAGRHSLAPFMYVGRRLCCPLRSPVLQPRPPHAEHAEVGRLRAAPLPRPFPAAVDWAAIRQDLHAV